MPNRDGHIMIPMGVEAALSTNPNKGRAGKRKKKDTDRLKDVSTGG